MSRTFIRAALAVCLLWVTGPTYAQESPVRMALVIGNSKYEQTTQPGMTRLTELPNACSDAQTVGAKLVTLGWQEDSEVSVKCDQTKEQMQGLIGRFVDKFLANPGAVAIFYYAGHGVQVDARAFLFGTDAAINVPAEKRKIEENPTSRLFAASAIDTLNDFLSQVNIVDGGGFTALFDACRSDPLILALNGQGLRRVTAPEPVTQYAGQLIGVSTQNGDVSLDGIGGGGPYAQALNKQLDTDRRLTKIMRDVQRDVYKSTLRLNPTRPQIPTYNGSSDVECLGTCRDKPVAPHTDAHTSLAPNARLMPASYMPDQSTTATQPETGMASGPPSKRGVEQLWRQNLPTLAAAPPPETPLRINVFWCDGVTESATNNALAQQIAQTLSGRARTSNQIQFVNVRSLSVLSNGRSGQRHLANDIELDGQNGLANIWTQRAVAAAGVPLARINGKIRDDLNIYICGVAARPGPPARAFWHVPDRRYVDYARSLQGAVDENAAGLTSVRGIEVVPNAPEQNEVRYYYDQDRAPAYRLADTLERLTGAAVTAKYFATLATGVPQGNLEAWLGKAYFQENAGRLDGRRAPKAIIDAQKSLRLAPSPRNAALKPAS